MLLRWGSGFLILLTLMMLTYSPPVQAATDIKVTIDGKLRYFETPVQISNNRVMIPVRFVIEDPALQGKVYWDARMKKVAIDCRGRYIELFIGSLKASVDGNTVAIDSAPYIYNSRTYIPLRFLTENLGAVVDWNSGTREVTIDFSREFTVMPYYYMPARSELETNADLFTDVAFRWFKTDALGTLSYEYRDDYPGVMALASSKGLRTHASVVLMGSEQLHQLLASAENRSRLIGNIMDRINNDGYDGVNIDFELMAAADAELFTTFLRELKTSLGDKTLSVAVFARTASDKWPTPYQYARIGQIADQVVVMAYDYHYRTSAPGAVAPLWWVQQVTDYMTANIPAHKVLLGLATYGYDWPAGSNATTVSAKKLADLKARYTLVETFDKAAMSPSYSYWDQYGVWHQIWMENGQSLQAKVELARAKKLGGVSFWRIGTGFTDLYGVLKQNQ
ncbi:MAG: glycosyl hydrolase family 18 protein [Deltaproteobacteria bacterium]